MRPETPRDIHARLQTLDHVLHLAKVDTMGPLGPGDVQKIYALMDAVRRAAAGAPRAP